LNHRICSRGNPRKTSKVNKKGGDRRKEKKRKEKKKRKIQKMGSNDECFNVVASNQDWQLRREDKEKMI
jgi:hypothetical protein